MFSRRGGLSLIQDLIQQGRYDWSNKIDQLINEGWFDEEDLEVCILTGVVQKTERDRRKNSVGNKIYVIIGRDTHGNPFYTVGKILKADDGNFYFFITAHEAR